MNQLVKNIYEDILSNYESVGEKFVPKTPIKTGGEIVFPQIYINGQLNPLLDCDYPGIDKDWIIGYQEPEKQALKARKRMVGDDTINE